MPKAFQNLSRSAQSRILRRLPGRIAAAHQNNDLQLEENHGGIENDDEANDRVPDIIEHHTAGSSADENSDSSDSESGVEDEMDDSDQDDAQSVNNNVENPSDADERSGSDSSDDEFERFDFYAFGERGNNGPLYLGAPITVMESMCLILTLVLKHHLTGTCVADILTVINMHCLQQQLKRHSFEKYKKFFSIPKSKANKHYYCSSCFKALESAAARCTCAKGVSYFVQFPLIPQLEQCFQRDNFFNLLQHRFTRQKINDEGIEDIYDGLLYKQFFNEGFLSEPTNISFMWNADGVPVFKSKNYSIWPFYLSINELPYKQRFERKYALLAGLWFGRKKPLANLFLPSFKRDLERLYHGVNLHVPDREDPYFVRAMMLAGTCDLPAKSTFLNFSQFNAESGCPHCETEGMQVLLPSQKPLRVYHYERETVKRTKENCRVQAREAIETNEPVKGVKGPTYLDNLMPDFLSGMAIDSMHNASGIVKKLLKLWFDSKFSRLEFSLRQVLGNVDELLLRLKPPKFIHRMPRSIEDLCHWKASELFVWLYYYSPVVLQNIMMPRYYQHYMKLVAALSYLSCPSISNDMIEVANLLLHEFVENYQDIYGIRHCTMNTHLLLHLADQVKTLGPLFVSSCFGFENLNSKLLSGIHGSTCVDSQVTHQHWQILCSAKYFDRLAHGIVRDFCVWERKKFKVLSRIADSCYSVGYYCDPEPHFNIIRAALHASELAYQNVMKYCRLFKETMMYVSESYIRDVQTKSSVCLYSKDDIRNAGEIVCFVKLCQYCPQEAKCECPGEHFAIVKKILLGERACVEYNNNRLHATLDYLIKCYLQEDVAAVPVSSLITVCFYMNSGNQSFIALPAHLREVQ